MSDTEVITAKKTVKRKKDLCIVNISKEYIEITIIINRILDLNIYLTVNKLRTLVLTIKKQLTKTISKKRNIQFCINI